MEGSESRPVGATMDLKALPEIREDNQKERQRNQEKELDREGRTGSPGQPPPTPPDRKYPEGVPDDHPISKLSRLVLDTLRPRITRMLSKCRDIFPLREDLENDLTVEVFKELLGEEDLPSNTLKLYDLASRALNRVVKRKIGRKKGRRGFD